MDRSKIKINKADEEDMQEMADGINECPFRYRRNWHFGAAIKCECHQRVLFEKEFEYWLVNIKPKQRAEEKRLKQQGE